MSSVPYKSMSDCRRVQLDKTYRIGDARSENNEKRNIDVCNSKLVESPRKILNNMLNFNVAVKKHGYKKLLEDDSVGRNVTEAGSNVDLKDSDSKSTAFQDISQENNGSETILEENPHSCLVKCPDISVSNKSRKNLLSLEGNELMSTKRLKQFQVLSDPIVTSQSCTLLQRLISCTNSIARELQTSNFETFSEFSEEHSEFADSEDSQSDTEENTASDSECDEAETNSEVDTDSNVDDQSDSDAGDLSECDSEDNELNDSIDSEEDSDSQDTDAHSEDDDDQSDSEDDESDTQDESYELSATESDETDTEDENSPSDSEDIDPENKTDEDSTGNESEQDPPNSENSEDESEDSDGEAPPNSEGEAPPKSDEEHSAPGNDPQSEGDKAPTSESELSDLSEFEPDSGNSKENGVETHSNISLTHSEDYLECNTIDAKLGSGDEHLPCEAKRKDHFTSCNTNSRIDSSSKAVSVSKASLQPVSNLKPTISSDDGNYSKSMEDSVKCCDEANPPFQFNDLKARLEERCGSWIEPDTCAADEIPLGDTYTKLDMNQFNPESNKSSYGQCNFEDAMQRDSERTETASDVDSDYLHSDNEIQPEITSDDSFELYESFKRSIKLGGDSKESESSAFSEDDSEWILDESISECESEGTEILTDSEDYSELSSDSERSDKPSTSSSKYSSTNSEITFVLT